jgi:hypothetical protein
LGAGSMLVREDFCFLCSAKRALRAASQSKTEDELMDRALNGDRALRGDSRCEIAGLGGSRRLGKVAGPVGGADSGPRAAAVAEAEYGLGGTHAAVAGGERLLLAIVFTEVVLDEGEGPSTAALEDASDLSLLAVLGTESGVISPEAAAVAAADAEIGAEAVVGVGAQTEGELRNIALERKSV